MSYARSTAAVIPFVLVNRVDGTGLTGATVTTKVKKDTGSQQSVEGTVVELGGGQYALNASAADMNGEVLGFFFTATNAVPVGVTIRTDSTIAMAAVYTYGGGITVGQTLAEQLLSVQAAILAIESGAQAVSLDGATLNRGNLNALYEREERLQQRINFAGRRRISVAEF